MNVFDTLHRRRKALEEMGDASFDLLRQQAGMPTPPR